MRDAHVTLAQCEILVAAVDTGSLTGAGRALGISQSAVSHALAALEAELGVALLERGRAGARPTEVGERVVAQARAVLLHAEELRREATATLALTKGTLRVGTIASVAARLLPRLIRRFGERCPGVTLELREGTDAEVRSWLLGYEVDVGVVTLPCAGLVTTPLLSDAMVAVMPVDHPLGGDGGGVRVADLAEAPFLMSAGGCEPLT
jgi:DNA-binding transcriptional LysR family regulator